jgi:hypothetical protein
MIVVIQKGEILIPHSPIYSRYHGSAREDTMVVEAMAAAKEAKEAKEAAATWPTKYNSCFGRLSPCQHQQVVGRHSPC